MYNKELNDHHVDRFRGAVAGKRVLFVGNSASLISSDHHGELIDSFDFVLRFGKGWPHPLYAKYVGTRTDAWFFGAGRVGMYKKFVDVPWKIYTPSQLKVYEGAEDCLLSRSMLDGSFQIYRDFFMTGDSNRVVELNKRVNGEQAKFARLSQGIQAIEWLTKDVCSHADLTLIGFDFFAQPATYTYDNKKYPDIPRTHPITSWHVPLVNNHYTTNPHAFGGEEGGMTNEERYIRSIPGINIIPMPKIDADKLDELIKRIRGPGSSINRE